MRLLLLSIFLATSSLYALSSTIDEVKDFQVDLKDPVFTDGVIVTDQGGVISSEGIRIQAKTIRYTNRIENGIAVRKIEAEGDLLFQYADQIFVGKKIEYDLLSKTGVIEEGTTQIEVWFVGGEKIYVQKDGSYYILNAYITTWASDNPLWEVHAGKIRITEDKILSARNLYFRIAKFPFFWIPSLKANLNFIKKPPIRYKFHWDKGLGPRISARYLVYSIEDLSIYLRGDYRIAKGGALALETEYQSEDHRTEFVTRSYGSIDDKSTPIQKKPDHYRLQGLFSTESKDEKTKVHLIYDKISDQAMISEFMSDDFEINTGQRTHLFIEHATDRSFVDFQFEPRINPWQSLNQQLPSLSIGVKTFELGSTGVLFHNFGKAAFLDYTYADNLKSYIHNIHSVRLETVNSIDRPFALGGLTFTPNVGFVAIFYNNSPLKCAIGQLVGTYGASLSTNLGRSYSSLDHIIEPYLIYQGLTQPKATQNDVYIFSLRDGYHKLNSLKVGFKNSIESIAIAQYPFSYGIDLYTYLFFAGRGDLSVAPRLYLDFSLKTGSNESSACFVWNIQEHLVDRINARTSWTLNENLAFVLEMRHRSRFDWRKADHDNFILDTARPFQDLLQSPISDGRNTLLLRAQIRIHPLWTMHIAGHGGWARSGDPAYHSAKVDLYTTVLTGWKLRLSGTVTADDTSFDAGIELIKH